MDGTAKELLENINSHVKGINKTLAWTSDKKDYKARGVMQHLVKYSGVGTLPYLIKIKINKHYYDKRSREKEEAGQFLYPSKNPEQAFSTGTQPDASMAAMAHIAERAGSAAAPTAQSIHDAIVWNYPEIDDANAYHSPASYAMKLGAAPSDILALTAANYINHNDAKQEDAKQEDAKKEDAKKEDAEPTMKDFVAALEAAFKVPDAPDPKAPGFRPDDSVAHKAAVEAKNSIQPLINEAKKVGGIQAAIDAQQAMSNAKEAMVNAQRAHNTVKAASTATTALEESNTALRYAKAALEVAEGNAAIDEHDEIAQDALKKAKDAYDKAGITFQAVQAYCEEVNADGLRDVAAAVAAAAAAVAAFGAADTGSCDAAAKALKAANDYAVRKDAVPKAATAIGASPIFLNEVRQIAVAGNFLDEKQTAQVMFTKNMEEFDELVAYFTRHSGRPFYFIVDDLCGQANINQPGAKRHLNFTGIPGRAFMEAFKEEGLQEGADFEVKHHGFLARLGLGGDRTIVAKSPKAKAFIKEDSFVQKVQANAGPEYQSQPILNLLDKPIEVDSGTQPYQVTHAPKVSAEARKHRPGRS